MGCTLDHSLVAFSTSRQYTECVLLIKEASLHLALQAFEDVKCCYTIICFTLIIKITCKILSTSCGLEGQLYILGIKIK